MLLAHLVLALLALPEDPGLAVGPGQTTASCQPEHGDLAWFEGTWEELMEEAERSETLVFVSFWTEWCNWCKQLDKDTFSNREVIAVMDGLLCYSVDAESEDGAPLARRFGLSSFPAMAFLEPSGEVRDFLPGYSPPKPFLGHVRRIQRNEGTVRVLLERIAADSADLEARYDYAVKLRELGNKAGFREQVAAMRAHDPDGRSRPVRRIRLQEILETLDQDEELDLDPLYAWIEAEEDTTLVFDAWYGALHAEDQLVGRAKTPEEAESHRRRWMRATRALWTHAPDKRRKWIGNFVAWGIYERRASLQDEDLEFALDVAREAVRLAPKDANVVDTLACCQYALGQEEQALANVRRCIGLQPDNPEWRRRLEDFGGL